MAQGWIDATKFSFNTLLLFDRWIIRNIAKKNPEFHKKLAIALSGNPAVFWYFINKCPECAQYYQRLLGTAPSNSTHEDIRNSEVFVLNELDSYVVYVYPELMEELSYIKDWEKQQRFDIKNVYVIDGTIESIPFPDESFDIVMSGHVFGENYEKEWQSMSPVTKCGGWVIDCPGGDNQKRPNGPSKEMLQLGFEYAHYVSKTGGDVYRYWKQKK
jgi:Methyltransferase domain